MNKPMEISEEHTYQPLTGACPVVGIGASAGGLKAIIVLRSHLPNTTGLAYVGVQHLDPKAPTFLADLLAPASRLPVQVAKEPLR